MVNEREVLKRVNPYLNKRNQLLKNDFKKLFQDLRNDDLKLVLTFLKSNSIEVLLKENTPIKKETKIVSKDLNKLSNEQLCKLYNQGHKEVLATIIEKNRSLIWSRVRRFSKYFNHKLDEEDLYQSGVIGLIQGVNKYEGNNDANLITYAIWWIDQKIRRDIVDLGFTIRIPVHMVDTIVKVNKIIAGNESLTKDELTNLMEEYGISKEKFEQAMYLKKYLISPGSLNVLVGEEADSELGNFLEDKEYELEKEVEMILLKGEIITTLNSLSPKEEKVLELRFGLLDGRERTLEEIGREFGVTRERIRQIVTKALEKIRKSKNGKLLKEYLIEG